MTVLVGVRCQDGVVIGADNAVTYAPVPDPQQYTVELSQGFKLSNVADEIIVATTGEVGLGQRLVRVVADRFPKAADLRKIQSVSATEVATDLAARAHVEFKKTLAPWDRHYGLGALFGIVLQNEPRLIWFDGVYFRPELVGERSDNRFRTAPIVTMGSGQRLADPFLAHAHRVLFGENHFPTVKEARLLVAWTLNHAIRYNTGGVGGDSPDISILEKNGAGQWCVNMWNPGEAKQAVDDIERDVGGYFRRWAESEARAPDLNLALQGGGEQPKSN